MRLVISLDIGGTNTRFALIDEDYEILKTEIRPTVTGDLHGFLYSVSQIIADNITDFTDIIGISAGVPGRVGFGGHIDALPNIGIYDIPLGEYLEEKFHLPVKIANDAEVASLAEANVGEHRYHDSLYFVTVSTGIGGALTRKGRFVQSSNEVGHTLVEYEGKKYEYEYLASGNGIVRLCALNGLKVDNGKEFFELYQSGNKTAKKVYNDWLTLLSSFVNMNQKNFEPEVFAFTGGVMKAKDVWFDDFKARCPNSTILDCSCGQLAGLFGAAANGFLNL